MAFWTGNGPKEPKRNFRFQVSMGGLNNDKGPTKGKADSSIVWWAKKVTKPNFTIGEGKHVYLGHTFYYPGKVEWQEISMTLVDPITPNASGIFMDMVAKSGYVLPKDSGSKATLGKYKFNKDATGLGSVVITQMDSEGEPVETWTLKNAFIKSLKLGDLDYESEDLSTVELALRYDWAECNTGDSNFFTINS
tara:strand:+ start:1509 stop:2087 length:579 start_codon:yes stop_codon:yes gene_type:complete